MSLATFASGTAAGGAVAVILLLPILGRPAIPPPAVPHTPAPTRCAGIGCQILPSDEALQLERRLERRGFVCTGKARLSESVIVDVTAGARLVPFDRAMRLGNEGAGWMRSYCSQP